MHFNIACYIGSTLYIQYLHVQNKVKTLVYRDANIHNVNYSIFIFPFLSEAADDKIDRLEDNAIEVIADVTDKKELDVVNIAHLDVCHDIGNVMPKKKTGWKHTLVKLFSSCFKANKKHV